MSSKRNFEGSLETLKRDEHMMRSNYIVMGQTYLPRVAGHKVAENLHVTGIYIHPFTVGSCILAKDILVKKPHRMEVGGISSLLLAFRASSSKKAALCCSAQVAVPYLGPCHPHDAAAAPLCDVRSHLSLDPLLCQGVCGGSCSEETHQGSADDPSSLPPSEGAQP